LLVYRCDFRFYFIDKYHRPPPFCPAPRLVFLTAAALVFLPLPQGQGAFLLMCPARLTSPPSLLDVMAAGAFFAGASVIS
jgi:hypothetical protein